MTSNEKKNVDFNLRITSFDILVATAKKTTSFNLRITSFDVVMAATTFPDGDIINILRRRRLSFNNRPRRRRRDFLCDSVHYSDNRILKKNITSILLFVYIYICASVKKTILIDITYILKLVRTFFIRNSARVSYCRLRRHHSNLQNKRFQILP